MYIVKKYIFLFFNLIDDIIFVGIIGFIKVIEIYFKVKFIKFFIYAVKCIENEILMYLR